MSIFEDRENLERCLGFIRTHFNCPECNYDFDLEGDRSSEVITCPDCNAKFWCREVR